MDVSDLLSFKPETIPKRKPDDEGEANAKTKGAAAVAKKPKFDEKILQLIDAEEQNDEDSDVLDEIGLKKLALVFEKRVLNNQKMRLKYPDDAQKFMVSRQIQPNQEQCSCSEPSTIKNRSSTTDNDDKVTKSDSIFLPL